MKSAHISQLTIRKPRVSHIPIIFAYRSGKSQPYQVLGMKHDTDYDADHIQTAFLEAHELLLIVPGKLYKITQPSEKRQYTVMIKGRDTDNNDVQVAFIWNTETICIRDDPVHGLKLSGDLFEEIVPLRTIHSKIRSMQSGTATLIFRSNLSHRIDAQVVIEGLSQPGLTLAVDEPWFPSFDHNDSGYEQILSSGSGSYPYGTWDDSQGRSISTPQSFWPR